MEENSFSNWLKENFYPSSIVFSTDRAKSIIAKNNLSPSEFLRPFGVISEVVFNQSEKFNITIRKFRMDFYDNYQYKKQKINNFQEICDNLLLSRNVCPDWTLNELKISRGKTDPLLSKLKNYSFPWFNEYEQLFFEFIRFYEYELYQQPLSYIYICSIDDNVESVIPSPEKVPPLISEGLFEANMPVLVLILYDLNDKERLLQPDIINQKIATFKSKFKDYYMLYLPMNSNDPNTNPIRDDIWKEYIHKIDIYSNPKSNDIIRGQYISKDERIKLRESFFSYMNIYVVKAIIRIIQRLDYEITTTKKGIKNTLFSVFKPNEKREYNSYFNIYQLTRLEKEEYLLAMIQFYFRNYEGAYENLKIFMSDMKNRSIHHYNAALELSNICYFMINPDSRDKDYQAPYQHYLKTHQYIQAFRALLIMVRIYEQKRLFNAIPPILIKSTREIPHSQTKINNKLLPQDRVISRLLPLILEKVSVYYLLQKEKLMKQYSLYTVLAGLSFKNDNPEFYKYTLNCYGNIFRFSDEKNASFVRTKETMNKTMGDISKKIKYYEGGLKFYKNCIELGKYFEKDIKEQYDNMILCLKEVIKGEKEGNVLGSNDLSDLTVPEVDNTSLLILEEQDYQISEDKNARGNWLWFNKFSIVPLKKIYLSLSPNDIISLRNLDNIIAKKQNFSNFYSKRNFKGNVNHKMYVRFTITNPLNFSLVITSLKLICDFAPLSGPSNEEDIEYQNISFTLQPFTSRVIELYCKPLTPGHCIMKGVEITLDNIAVIKHYFNKKNLSSLYNYRRKRKNSTSTQSGRKGSTNSQHSNPRSSNASLMKNSYNKKADITFDIIDNESDLKIEFPMGSCVKVYKNQLVLIPIKITNHSSARIKRICLFFKEDDLSGESDQFKTNQNVLCDYIYKEVDLMNNDNNSKQVTIYVPVVPKKIGELYIKILVKFEEEIALKDIEVQKYFMRLLVDESVEFDIKEQIIKFDSEGVGPDKKKFTFSLDTIGYIANKATFSNLKIGNNVFTEPEFIREDSSDFIWDNIENKDFEKKYHKFKFSKTDVASTNSMRSFLTSFSKNFSTTKKIGEIMELATKTNFDFLPDEINNDPLQSHIKHKLATIMLKNNLIFKWSCSNKVEGNEINGLYFHQTSLRLPNTNLKFIKQLMKTISSISAKQDKIDDKSTLITITFTLDKKYLSELNSISSYEIFVNDDVRDTDYKWIGMKKFKVNNQFIRKSNNIDDYVLKLNFTCLCYRKGTFDINRIAVKFNLKTLKDDITIYNSPTSAIVNVL